MLTGGEARPGLPRTMMLAVTTSGEQNRCGSEAGVAVAVLPAVAGIERRPGIAGTTTIVEKRTAAGIDFDAQCPSEPGRDFFSKPRKL
mmetsp:Transcript_12819/g.38722  ORF Transcript_12819/g.38722 Transcript_12819/m.38722 type:complete len:88 (+) Transcript_12819:1475-1738(+)